MDPINSAHWLIKEKASPLEIVLECIGDDLESGSRVSKELKIQCPHHLCDRGISPA